MDWGRREEDIHGGGREREEVEVEEMNEEDGKKQ
jgi:hypothetical protein